MNERLAAQPKSIPSKIATHHVHLIRPSLPATTSVNNVVLQSVDQLTPPVPVMKKVNEVDQVTAAVPAKSTHRIQPMIISSKSTTPTNKTQHSGRTAMESSKQCGTKIADTHTMQGCTNSPVIKTESPSDGKKIKILSDVSLNDAKAKLLEIDKLSSKNLKFTNVIKGTDKSSSKSTVHVSDSVSNPVMPSVKFTNVITGTNDSRTNSTVYTSCSTSRPTIPPCTSSKPFKPEIKVISSKNLKSTNVIDGMDKNMPTATFHVSNSSTKPVRSSSTTTSFVKIENDTFSSWNSKFANVTDGIDKNRFTAQPVRVLGASSISVKVEKETISPKILNFSNATEGITSRPSDRVYIYDSINLPTRSSCMTSKPLKVGIDNISSKNLNFSNASKSAATFSYSTNKPLYSPSMPIKSEIEEIRPNDSNLPQVKRTKDFPLQTTAKTTVFKVKPVIPMCSTSTDGSTKPMANADENIEIIMPSKQKYFSKKDRGGGMTDSTGVNDATKSLKDGLWATNNPRTYARHNIKRLLSDKIIKKARTQDESVQNVLCTVENEQTFEIIIPSETATSESMCDATPVQCDLKLEKSALVISETVCNQPTPTSTSACTPIDDSVADVNTQPNTVSNDDFNGFSIEEVNESAAVMNRIKTCHSRKQPTEARLDSTVGCVNDDWILNYETGVLEEQIDKDVSMVSKQEDVPPLNTDTNLSEPNAETESPSTKQISAITPVVDDASNVRSEIPITSTISDRSPIPSKIAVTEDADDEISDIDLVRRSKAKCTGSSTTTPVKNRRAILKSIELHRKAFISTTTDDESELSLCVRPPRPKLRKLRPKQTVEQLNIQQNAHVSLLKRFTQTDLDRDDFNVAAIDYFVDGMMGRIEVLENQVKSSFHPQKRNACNVETINLSEQCVSTDTVTVKNESVKLSEKVTESNELVKPSESSSSVNTSMNCVVSCEPSLNQSNSENNADTADDGKGKRIPNHMKFFVYNSFQFIELFIFNVELMQLDERVEH